MAWDRLLWGVEFRGGRARFLIGEGWRYGPRRPTAYPGEPTRALLFTTRRLARKFCVEQRTQYARESDGKLSCRQWRFRAVRVRETVIPLDTARGSETHMVLKETYNATNSS